MQIEYSGYREGYGSFYCQVYVDESRTDYEIHYKNGMIARQKSGFESITADWNHDGDVYAQFGAWFSCKDKDGKDCGSDFWTPVDMVFALVEAKEKPKSKIYDNDIVDIPGIKLPSLKVRPSLTEQLSSTEKRREAMEIARNKKMKDLNIRHPGEPWAR